MITIHVHSHTQEIWGRIQILFPDFVENNNNNLSKYFINIDNLY